MALLQEFADLLAKEKVETKTPLPAFTDKDVLIVVDMQNDFIPKGDRVPDGGRFAVAEGDQCVAPCIALIEKAVAAKAKVFATRDYHPVDHCSFLEQGGPFPTHCVQGHIGSFFQQDLAAALQPHVASGAAKIVFKAFTRDCDSFGAFPYEKAEFGPRISCTPNNTYCQVSWTGAFSLFSSNMKADCNAPPDVTAVLERKTLQEELPAGQPGTIYVCGLAADFCVLDTCVNAAKAGHAKVGLVLDAARAAHIPGVGQFGTGFLSDPAAIAGKLAGNKIQLFRM